MGGRALGFESIRLNRTQYLEARRIVKEILKHFPKIRYEIVKSYAAKDSFGDMDVVYTSDDPHYNFVEDYIKTVSPLLWTRNGTILSVSLMLQEGVFQIDFIRLKPETFWFGYDYFNYNDLGNFLGRVFHKAGFKLCYDGLKYVIRDGTTVIKELTVSTNWADALKFMGYDDYFYTRFDYPEDLYRYAVSSPYANRDIYLLDNTSHKARVRDRKRKMYSNLLEYLADKNNKCPEFDWTDKEKIREVFLSKAFEKWPEFKREYLLSMIQYQEQKMIKAKFNGHIVHEITGLREKELGMFMSGFREMFRAAIQNSTEKQIEALVRLYKEQYWDNSHDS